MNPNLTRNTFIIIEMADLHTKEIGEIQPVGPLLKLQAK